MRIVAACTSAPAKLVAPSSTKAAPSRRASLRAAPCPCWCKCALKTAVGGVLRVSTCAFYAMPCSACGRRSSYAAGGQRAVSRALVLPELPCPALTESGLLAVKVACERLLVGDVEALNSLAATCTRLRSLAREPTLYRRVYLSDLRPSALHPNSLRPMLSDEYLRLVVSWADGGLELLDITNCVRLSETAVMEVLELQPKLTTLLALRYCVAATQLHFSVGALLRVLSRRRRLGWPALLSLHVGALKTAWRLPRGAARCVEEEEEEEAPVEQVVPNIMLSQEWQASATLSTLQSHCKELNVDSVCTSCFCLMAGPKNSWCVGAAAAAGDIQQHNSSGVAVGTAGGFAELPDDRLLRHCVEKVWCERCMIRAARTYDLPPLIAYRCSSCADVLLPDMRLPDYCVGCMVTNSGACCSACSRTFVPGCVSCRAVQQHGSAVAGGRDEMDMPKQCNNCGAKFCKHCGAGSCLWCGVSSYTLLV